MTSSNILSMAKVKISSIKIELFIITTKTIRRLKIALGLLSCHQTLIE